MKKKILILAASSLIACSNVFATMYLGEGNIGSGENGASHYNSTAELSLSDLILTANYNVICKITAPNAEEYPVIVRFDIQNSGTPVTVYFEYDKLFTNQARISDNSKHTVYLTNVSRSLGNTSVLLTWLAGDINTADPVHYECYAEPAFGLAK